MDDFHSRFKIEDRADELPPIFASSEKQENITYLTKPKSCESSDLAVLVKTARSEKMERDWIRDYSQKMAEIGNFTFTLVFLLGDKNDGNTDLLMHEAKKYDDILIGKFIDTYDNLPLKTYLGYQYFSEECTNIPYVVFQASSHKQFSSFLKKFFKKVFDNDVQLESTSFDSKQTRMHLLYLI